MADNIYPRIYRYGWGWRTAAVIMMLFFAGTGGAAIALDWFKAVIGGSTLIGAVIGVGGMAMMLPMLYMRLTLYDDRLIYRGYLGRVEILRRNILRTGNVQRSWGIVTLDVHRRETRWPVTISDFGKSDGAFVQWFDSIPNREDEAAQKQSEVLLANPAFGRSVAEREMAVAEDARRLNLLRWPCYAVTMWGLIFPRPYIWCIAVLLALPVLGALMVLGSRRKWELNDDPSSGRIGIGGLMATGPAFVLGLRAFMDDQVLNWIVPVAWAMAVAAVLYLIVCLIEGRFQLRRIVLLSVVYFAYAWGGLLFANNVLDQAGGRSEPVRILEKSEGQNLNELTVTHWGDREDGNKVAVFRGFIRGVEVGDTVCVYTYPGLLGWAWYDVGHCPKPDRRS